MLGIILKTVGKICEHNMQDYENHSKEHNNAQIYEHNSLIFDNHELYLSQYNRDTLIHMHTVLICIKSNLLMAA